MCFVLISDKHLLSIEKSLKKIRAGLFRIRTLKADQLCPYYMNELKTLGEVKDLISDPNYQWKHLGNCVNHDTGIFIMERDLRGLAINKLYKQALEICKECPVRAECLAYAIKNYCSEGVWGGTIPAQRKGLHKNRKVRDLFPERKKR